MSASVWAPGDVDDINQVNGDNTFLTERFVATAGQKDFTITNFKYAINTNSLEVNINGIKQASVYDFTETTQSTFQLVEAAEAGDVIDVRGLVGASGTQSAADSAAAAQASAEAAEATYQNVLALNIPSLPLDLEFGGLGKTYPKGSIPVKTGTANALLAAGDNGFKLTTDSTTPTGLKWIRDTWNSKQLALNDSLSLLSPINYHYTTVDNSNISIDVTGIALNTVVALNQLVGSANVVTSTNVQVNFITNNEYQLYNNTIKQGIWYGNGITYGRVRKLTTNSIFLASMQFDADIVIMVFANPSVANTLYVTGYNSTTKTILNTVIITDFNLDVTLYNQNNASTAPSGTGMHIKLFREVNNEFNMAILPQHTNPSGMCWFTVTAGVIARKAAGLLQSAPNTVGYEAYGGLGADCFKLKPGYYIFVRAVVTSQYGMISVNNPQSYIQTGPEFNLIDNNSNNQFTAIRSIVGTAYGFMLAGNANNPTFRSGTYAADGSSITMQANVAGNIATSVSTGNGKRGGTLIPIPGTTDEWLYVTEDLSSNTSVVRVRCAANGTITVVASSSLSSAATGVIGISSVFDPKVRRTEVEGSKLPLWFYLGNLIVLANSNTNTVVGVHSSIGASTLKVTGIPLANNSRVYKSMSTGKVYALQSSNTVHQIIEAANNVLSLGTLLTNFTLTNTSPEFFSSESVFGQQYWNYNAGAGTSTVIGKYPINIPGTVQCNASNDGKHYLINDGAGFSILDNFA